MGIHNDKRICKGHILVLEFSGYLWSLLLNSVSGDSCRPTYWYYSTRVCLYSVQRANVISQEFNMWLRQLVHLIFLLLFLTPFGDLNIICSGFF